MPHATSSPRRYPIAGLFTLLRGGAILLVFTLMLGALASGVGTTEQPDLAQQSPLAWIYYAGGLFVFGGLDLGTPTGGPTVGQAAMWSAFFLAPIITTSAVAEAFTRLVKPGWLQKRKLRNHVVIVGAGQIGSLYVESVRALEPSRPILLVDRDAGLATTAEALRHRGVHFLQGDVRRPVTLEAMQLGRAHALVVLTEDDLINLEAAWAAWQESPQLPIATHVADLTLLRPVERVATEGNAPVGFNTHQIGAQHLYLNHLAEHFLSTGYKDIVVLVGFGRFAQTLLELMLAEEADNLKKIIIVDRNASFYVRRFEVDVQQSLDRVVVLDGDPIDPATWKSIEEAVAEEQATPVYLLCGSSEVTNLRAAMLLRQQSTECRIFARCFHHSQFVDSLSKQLRVEMLSFEDLLRASLKEHYESEFCRHRRRRRHSPA
ncbi:MAG: hypothetical protein GY811_06780 [Myxococcales bacterium]|nr:hypothetical protein [Myxococcales bacterium]